MDVTTTTTVSADTTYQIDQSYNAQTGYLHSITYPTSTNGPAGGAGDRLHHHPHPAVLGG